MQIKLIIKRSFLPVFIVSLFLIGMFNPIAFSSQASLKIMILPFTIHATEDLEYLSTQIADVLANQLKAQGATLLPLPSDLTLSSQKAIDIAKIKKIARQAHADRIIWGSFTRIGQRFSLDAKMASPLPNAPAEAFNVEGTQLENLLTVLNTLGQEITLKLFKHDIIAEVRITGNARIESDAIQQVIKTKVGGIYLKNQISDDIKTIFKMGYFDDLSVDAQSGPKGKIVTFKVKEKPTIRRIKIAGNLRFDDDEIKENLTISTGAILNINKIRHNIEQIETMYKEKNYHQVKVEYKILPLANNQADIEFNIEEGPKIYVTTIEFQGNKAFETKELKKQIQTSEKGFWYWLTSSGDLDRTKLDQDSALLNNFYHNQGYIHARVADPQVKIEPSGIRITFKIEEDKRYKVGNIDVAGDLILPKKSLLKDLNLGREVYFSREKLRNDVFALKDLYGNYGYAYADVKPRINENRNDQIVNITYDIEKHQEVYFENIDIAGNALTRDKVIRRELRVHEQERFDGAALKKSIRRLYRLDYFDDIKVDSLKGSADDKMVLRLNVAEKPTGMFSFGAGYSSAENVFLVGSIAQRNFLGNGQTLKFEGQIGGSTTQYNASFNEPWLFDIPLSGTIRGYDQTKDNKDYDRHSKGGGLGLSYPIFEDTRIYWNYAFDNSDVSAIADNADDTIKELEGTNITSSISLALGYDSRNSSIAPTEGAKHSITYEYAGIGGDVGFDKITLETGWYFPLFKGLVGVVHGKFGTVSKNSNDKILPDYEKFYLGGINSLRGFDYRGVHISDINRDGAETKRGGTEMVQFNYELLIPLSKKVGLMGVVFYDSGNVYEDNIDLKDMRNTAGYGIRWNSMWPIRIEYGYNLNPRDDEEDGRWEFTIGGAF